MVDTVHIASRTLLLKGFDSKYNYIGFLYITVIGIEWKKILLLGYTMGK